MKKIGIISDTHSFWDDRYLKYFEPPYIVLSTLPVLAHVGHPPFPPQRPQVRFEDEEDFLVVELLFKVLPLSRPYLILLPFSSM